MRMNTGQGWVDMGPSTGGRPYLHIVTAFDTPSIEDIVKRTGCVACGVEVPRGRAFCDEHRKRWNRNTQEKAA